MIRALRLTLLYLLLPCSTSALAEPFISPEDIDAYLGRTPSVTNHSPIGRNACAADPGSAAGNGLAFVIYGLAYNVDPRLIIGIANAESTIGLHPCNTCNAWSWFWGKDPATSEGSCAFSPLTSWEGGIRGTTKDIRYSYLDDNKTTIAAIKGKYCKDACDPWVGNVEAVYEPTALGGDKTHLTFQPTRKFFADVEGDISEWSATGFWHVIEHPENVQVNSDISPQLVTLGKGFPGRVVYKKGFLPPATSGKRAFWYGEESTGTFIGADFRSVDQTPKGGGTSVRPNSGELITPPVDLQGLRRAFLVFQTWWEIESVDANQFDIVSESVKVEVSSGGAFQQVALLNPAMDVNGSPDIPFVSASYFFEPFNAMEPATPFWTPAGVDLSPYAGRTIRIRFRFDTRDESYNGFRGWLIDDVAVFGIQ